MINKVNKGIKIKNLIKVLLLLPVVFPVNAVAIKGDFSAIDRYVNAAKEVIGLPTGTAIAIVKDGKIVYQGYFGYADIEKGIKVNNETAFYIASVTKPLYALSTLLMEEKGDIHDTTTLAEMFPKLMFWNIDASKIQLANLMSHTAAIKNTPLVVSLAFTGEHDAKRRQNLLTMTVNDKKNTLGKFSYTNLGYNIASIWAEQYYHKEWQELLSESIYEPLGMTHTSSYMSDASTKGISVARPYGVNSSDPKQILAFEKSNQTMHAAGGAISTVKDFSRFLIAELNQGKVDNKQIFPASVIKKSQQQLVEQHNSYRDFKRTGYSWGWQIGPYKGEKMYHHFGGVAGTHAHSSFMLDHNIGLVVFNNESLMSSKLTNAIADIAYSILLDKGDANSKVKKHIKAMKKSWAKVRKDIKKLRKTVAKRNASRTMELSQDKVEYTGEYFNSSWGKAIVELDKNNQFKFTLGQLSTIATAYTIKDTMRVEFSAMGRGMVVAYKISDGRVKSFEIFGEISAEFEKLHPLTSKKTNK
ncbi:MAG: hypothetical protein COB35_03600 [Gammaproteobacteria bacterium]|nr:MAG: hypothetical protein COB35_03600 [Gammaproteobacteria bacterium]